MARLKSAILGMAILLLLYALTALVFYLAYTSTYKPTDAYLGWRIFMFLLFAPVLFKYLVQLLVAPWYSLVEFLRKRKSLRWPSVSVLIPAWNEEIGIRKTLESVVATRYPALEVIVVNDGSTDSTHAVVAAFIRGYTGPAKLEYLKVRNGGKARALNAALSHATGSIIVTVDADSAMHPGAIHNLVRRFDHPKVASVAGNVVIGNRSEPIGMLQQLEYLYGFYFKRADSIFGSVYIVGGAAAAYRARILKKVGGFDESIITEDIELSTRLQDKGYRIRYAADAVVYTEGPSDFKGLGNQRLRWKYGRLFTFYKYRHLFFSSNRMHNPVLSYLVLPVALFAETLLFFEVFLLGVFFVYTVTTSDYGPLATVIALIAAIVLIQIVSDKERVYHANLVLLAPVAWLLFYVIDFIEYQALIRSLLRLAGRQKLSWQRWNRVGVFGP